jgi:hypothetical protein
VEREVIYDRYRSHASLTPRSQGEMSDQPERAEPHLEPEAFPRSGYHVAARAHADPGYDFHRIEQALRRIARGTR